MRIADIDDTNAVDNGNTFAVTSIPGVDFKLTTDQPDRTWYVTSKTSTQQTYGNDYTFDQASFRLCPTLTPSLSSCGGPQVVLQRGELRAGDHPGRRGEQAGRCTGLLHLRLALLRQPLHR